MFTFALMHFLETCVLQISKRALLSRETFTDRSIGVGEGVAGGLQPPWLSRNLLHSGNFPEKTIGNLGRFSDFALLIRAELLQPP